MQTAPAHETQLEVKAAFKEEQVRTRPNEHNFPPSGLIVLRSTAEGCRVPLHHQKHRTASTGYSTKELTGPSHKQQRVGLNQDLSSRKSSPDSQQRSHLEAPSVPDENTAQSKEGQTCVFNYSRTATAPFTSLQLLSENTAYPASPVLPHTKNGCGSSGKGWIPALVQQSGHVHPSNSYKVEANDALQSDRKWADGMGAVGDGTWTE